MKRLASFITIAFTGAFLLAPLAVAQERNGAATQPGSTETQPGMAQQQEQKSPDQMKIRQAGDLTNFSIQNKQGEKLGQISELLVDIEKGRIGYVVVSANGILGVGGESHVVPWQALQFDPQREEVMVLDMERERFRQAPTGDAETVATQEQGRTIHEFYGVSPYWEEESGLERQNGQSLQEPQAQPGQQGEFNLQVHHFGPRRRLLGASGSRGIFSVCCSVDRPLVATSWLRCA